MTLSRALIVTRSYPPAFRGGGPAQSVFAIVTALQLDMDLFVLTAASDEGESLSDVSIEPDVWSKRYGSQTMYGTPSQYRMIELLRLIRTVKPDVVYLNTFFDPRFAGKLLLLRAIRQLDDVRLVVAPRGEFNEGALSLKHRKKSAYLAATRLAGLHRRIRWHATSPFEATRIHSVIGPEADVQVAPVLRDLSSVSRNHRAFADEGDLKLIFLSRISPMKNLVQAIEILARTQRATLTVAGPIGDPEYWRRCQEAIQLHGVSQRVTYLGPIQPGDVVELIASHDLLVLPTLGENFGHVILESLAAGTPVLISDRTPWADVESRGAGWVVPLGDTGAFAQRIDQLQQMSDLEFQQMRSAAQQLAYAHSIDPAAKAQMKRLLTNSERCPDE